MSTYVKYGDEWKNEVMKNSKDAIITMFRNVALERDSQSKRIEKLENLVRELEYCATLDGFMVCPKCEASEGQPHLEWCELYAAIAQEQKR